jgi:hypothetical protein
MVSAHESSRFLFLPKSHATEPRSLDLCVKTASVGPVQSGETPETLWGKDIAEPADAFEVNGFLMRRVVLSRPRRNAK